MSDYINREDAITIIAKRFAEALRGKTIGYSDGMLAAMDDLNDLPAADVAEVRHGHWEFPIFTDNDDVLDPRVKCSKCGKIEAAFARWKYCPNCGARMNEEDVHETG